MFGFILLTGLACSPQPEPGLDATEVEAAIRRFYDHISSYDYAALREASTPNYELLEQGERMDMDEFESMLRGMETRGVELTFELSEFNTDGTADVAYASYRMVSGSAVFLESSILRRSGDRWLAARGTSVRISQDDP